MSRAEAIVCTYSPGTGSQPCQLAHIGILTEFQVPDASQGPSQLAFGRTAASGLLGELLSTPRTIPFP